MSDQDSRRSRRVWSAEEIQEQLDQIGEVLARGPGEFLKGFLFGVPPRRRPKPQRRQEPRDDK
jgi:hypothetical protein